MTSSGAGNFQQKPLTDTKLEGLGEALLNSGYKLVDPLDTSKKMGHMNLPYMTRNQIFITNNKLSRGWVNLDRIRIRHMQTLHHLAHCHAH